MIWSPDLFIGEFRPWPDSVYVVRGKSDESRRYVPEDFSAMSRENAELRELLAEARDELVGMYEYLDGGYAWPSIEDDPSFGPFYKRLCDVLGIEVAE